MKRDLNLIPKAETQSTANKYLLPIFLIVVLYAATAYLAVTIPNQRLQAKEDEYAVLEQKVSELEPVEAQYQQLRAQLAEIEAKKETIEQTKHSDYDATNILELIEQACPEDVVVTEFDFSEDGITLAGTAASDSLVAEFMVNLRAIVLFSDSNITLVQAGEVDFAASQAALAEGTELPEVREFQLALAFSSVSMSDETSTED